MQNIDFSKYLADKKTSAKTSDKSYIGENFTPDLFALFCKATDSAVTESNVNIARKYFVLSLGQFVTSGKLTEEEGLKIVTYLIEKM